MTRGNIPTLRTAVMHSRFLAVTARTWSTKRRFLIQLKYVSCKLVTQERSALCLCGYSENPSFKKNELSKPCKTKLVKSLVQRSITLATLTPKFMVLGTNAAKDQNHSLKPQETTTLPSPPPSAAGREAEAGE